MRGVPRRGFLGGGLGLAWCAGCAPNGSNIRPAATAPVHPGPRERRAPVGHNWLCGEADLALPRQGPPPLRATVASACPPLTPQGCLPQTLPPLEPIGLFSSREFPLIAGPYAIRIRYWPDHPTDGLMLAAVRQRSGADAATPPPVREAAEAALDCLRRFGDRRLALRGPRLPEDRVLRIELKNLGIYRGVAYNNGSIAVDRSLQGIALRETIAHEIFHLIQFAYNPTPTDADDDTRTAEPLFTPMIREGGARVAEMVVHPNADRYEADAQDWFLPGGASLARYRAGRRRRFIGASYGGGLFWKYVAEQHGSQADPGRNRDIAEWRREMETQRHVLEASQIQPNEDAGGMTIEVLRKARRGMAGLGGFDQFLYVDGDRALPACAETTWGNFQVALLLNGTAGADSRFRFEDSARWRGITAGRQAVPQRQQAPFTSLPSQRALAEHAEALGTHSGEFGPDMLLAERLEAATTDLRIRVADALNPSAEQPLPESDNQARIPSTMLDPFSMMVFRITMPSALETRLLRVQWEPLEGLADGMVQVIALDRAAELQDLFRHDGQGRVGLDRTFALRGASEVLIIVASRVARGDFRLKLRQANDAPILAAGDWNAVSARHLTRDPRVFRTDWQSPDVAFLTGPRTVDAPGGGTITVPGSLLLLIRNRGVLRAEGLDVTARRRPLAGGAWEELRCLSLPGRLETDDECRRLETDVPLTDPLSRMPAPCRVVDAVFALPTIQQNTSASEFLWPSGAPRDYLVEFRAVAADDPNGPLLIRTSFGGGPPRLLPERPPHAGANPR